MLPTLGLPPVGESRRGFGGPNVGRMSDPQQPIVDLAPLITLMRRVENAGEEAGWSEGGHLRLMVVYEHSDVVTENAFATTLGTYGEAMRRGRYTLRPLIREALLDAAVAELAAQGEQMGSPYSRALANLSINMAFTTPEELEDDNVREAYAATRALLQSPGLVAFVISYEAWQAHGYPLDFLDVAAGRRRIADFPNAREVRIVQAIDALDRMHFVQRVRNGAVEIENEASVLGDFSGSLRMLMDLARDRLPSPEQFAERYPSLRTVLEARAG